MDVTFGIKYYTPKFKRQFDCKTNYKILKIEWDFLNPNVFKELTNSTVLLNS